ncbi:hypothetical protein HJC23_007927 [Cyclotella cryptica]|uniref:Uncharacterized protein n=1 Tax=Cyclotella cryptica TaxID=29204 RepID=A0ABD3NZQ3_9STRA
MRSPSDFFQRCVFAASGRSNTNSSKPNDGSSPAPTTDSPLALATPTANPPSVAKCVSTMPPTLPIMARLDMQRWCRYGCPLDPLENSPWSMDLMNAKLLVEASVKTRDKLDFAMGKGNDGDVPKVSFIEDSREFPFFNYRVFFRLYNTLKFHDGFKGGEDYPQSYNSLVSKFAKIEDFGLCPNGLVGIGIGGL